MLSVLLHLLIGFVLLVRIRQDFARVLDGGLLRQGTRGGGGGGGGRVAYISLPAPAPAAPTVVEVEPPKRTPPPVPVTPTPTPPVQIPPPEPEPVASAQPAASAPGDSVAGMGPGQGGGTGGGTGGGIGPGTGAGVGPGAGTGGGEGGRGKAPEPRQLILPPTDPPKELRGVTMTLTFWVDATGKVDRVDVQPEIRDRKFAAKVRDAMRNYRFHPGLGPDGAPIAAIYTHTLAY